jgi:hypothetical protein
MPLTAFQSDILRILAANRNPNSHVAGGAVINRADASFRYSDDLDIFHDAAESVAICAEADAEALLAAGCSVEWKFRREGSFRAEVSRGQEQCRLDWSYDSAFRFFPAEPDEIFGYCLHTADLATNKMLALGGRTEFRDFLDILYLNDSYLSLGAIAWAACGKDPGYTPSLLLDMANRHIRFQDDDLKGEHLVRPLDLRELKKHWLRAREQAEALFLALPEDELGCLYLGVGNQPVTPDPANKSFFTLKRHRGCVGGAWPKIS